MTIAVPFNDLGAMERRIDRLASEGRLPACVIMEAAMMNLGVVLPEPGYLEGVRELTKRHGIVLIFDEVKTGLTIAPGGATEYFGVKPDMVTLAKALGGGLPSGAIGGSDEVMEVVEDGTVYQVGTYNGNPLVMAAARANLLEVMTADAYAHLGMLNDRILAGCDAVLEKYNLPGYTVGIGSKGVVTFSPQKIVDYTTFKANQDGELLRPRVALQHEPRHLHDARPRGGVDAVDPAHGGGHRRVRGGLRGDGARPDRVGPGPGPPSPAGQGRDPHRPRALWYNQTHPASGGDVDDTNARASATGGSDAGT